MLSLEKVLKKLWSVHNLFDQSIVWCTLHETLHRLLKVLPGQKTSRVICSELSHFSAQYCQYSSSHWNNEEDRIGKQESWSSQCFSTRATTANWQPYGHVDYLTTVGANQPELILGSVHLRIQSSDLIVTFSAACNSSVFTCGRFVKIFTLPKVLSSTSSHWRKYNLQSSHKPS